MWPAIIWLATAVRCGTPGDFREPAFGIQCAKQEASRVQRVGIPTLSVMNARLSGTWVWISPSSVHCGSESPTEDRFVFAGIICVGRWRSSYPGPYWWFWSRSECQRAGDGCRQKFPSVVNNKNVDSFVGHYWAVSFVTGSNYS